MNFFKITYPLGMLKNIPDLYWPVITISFIAGQVGFKIQKIEPHINQYENFQNKKEKKRPTSYQFS